MSDQVDAPVLQREFQQRKERFQLAKLLRVTEEMLSRAQCGDWESVEEMELSRKGEIESCFADQGMVSSPLVAEALATLIFLNEQISQLVIQAKQDMLEARLSQMSGKSAALDYKSNMLD